MTAIPTTPETFDVTSCDGKVTHACRVLFRPTLRTPGLVQIGAECYRVTLCGSSDDMTFERPDGTVYETSAWGTARGNFRCTCPDHKYRSNGIRICKHGQVSLRLAQPAVPVEMSAAELGATCWEM